MVKRENVTRKAFKERQQKASDFVCSLNQDLLLQLFKEKSMPIPDYQKFMLPFLKFAADGKEHSLKEAYQVLSDQFGLTEDEKKIMLPSGMQSIVNNRIGWAKTYLKKSRLIESPKRGVFKITDRGIDVLKKNPSHINLDLLEQFPEFIEFKNFKNPEGQSEKTEVSTQTKIKNPEETIEDSFEEINSSLASEILETVKSSSPAFFEKMVIDLLLKMGYGGSRKDAGQAIGQSGDEGIDGIIKEDRLGLDIIYIQAKRWGITVIGRPEIQKFAGALQGKRAKKGIYITTSRFSKDAIDYANQIESKIILIDGESMTKLMLEHNVGVSISKIYEIKKVDHDYFEEEA
jgi:restriction system protein